jgi:hypothetical protein
MKVLIILSSVLLVSVWVPPAQAFFEILNALEKENVQEKVVEMKPQGFSDLYTELSAIQASLSFSDVDQNAWFSKYVDAVSSWGIVSGYKDEAGTLLGQFGPGDPLRIGEILKMALKAALIDETQCQGIASHPQAISHWANLFVVCAEHMNMRLFRFFPDLNRQATRAEVLTIIHDAFEESIPFLLSSFTDALDHPYESDIAYSALKGVVSGDTDSQGNPTGYFRPDDPVNRAEAAKIIYEQLIRSVEGDADLTHIPNQKQTVPVVREIPLELPSPSPSGLPSLTLKDLSPQGTSLPTIVRYTFDGYIPPSITISKGTSVIFQNESNSAMWTASNVHPSHTLYPGSSIQKCQSIESNQIFDSCEGIESGMTWTFRFSQDGSWQYHNHLNPSHGGAIVVK